VAVLPAHRRSATLAKLDDRKLKSLSRRELLKLAPVVAVGAFAITRLQPGLLKHGLGFSDWASARIFRQTHLAPTFPASDVVPFAKFPYNGYDVLDPEVDLEEWTLTVSGNVQKSGEYTLDQIKALPKVQQNTRHVCVEGWDVVGAFGGTRVSDFLAFVGADTHAKFLSVECADDYYESIDMATALHPQSLLCYEMYGQPLDRGHGAPLRLTLPTKLGYKHAKYLSNLAVTNVLNTKRGYWEDQGYSWHAGL
jgi:DMSO/TMAO reductase YedYZ molybdopterin-dependent catalytic subunit